MANEKEKLYNEIVAIMEDMIDDTSIPRNIRRNITHTKDTLVDEKKTMDMRVASAIFELEEISNDPNIPVHGRTVVYMIMSKLETLSKLLSE